MTSAPPPSEAAGSIDRRVERLAMTVPLAFAAIIWTPVLGCYFFGDDLLNLYFIVNKSLVEYLITPYGGHILPTRNIIFAIWFWLFGTDPHWYFVLMLLTHLVNVGLLFRIIRELTQSARLAGVGATLWGTTPVHEGALGWYSVYGQVLAASCCLWVLYRLCQVGAGRKASRLAPWRWALLMIAASTSFGVGIGFALALPLAAWLLLPPPAPDRGRIVGILTVAAMMVLALYFGLYVLSTHFYAYEGATRLGYLLLNLSHLDGIARMLAHLVSAGVQCLMLGPYGSLIAYGGPISIAVTAIAAALPLFLGAGSPALVRRRILALLVVSVACYGIIAAGRSMVFQGPADNFLRLSARYHYLALAPVAAVLCLLLGEAQRRWPLPSQVRDALLGAWLVVLVIGFAAFGPRIDTHETARQVTANTVAELRRLIGATPPGQSVFIENRPFAALGPFLINNPRVMPGWAAAFTIFFPENTVAGRRVFFVVADPAVRAAAAGGRRTAGLLVAPEDAHD